MKFVARNMIPSHLSAKLWGDRERWGFLPKTDDADWKEWQRISTDVYMVTQRGRLGTWLLNAGCQSISQVDLSGKRVLEIGAGDIQHISHWRGSPSEYLLADGNPKMLRIAEKRLEEAGVSSSSILLQSGETFPIEASSIDVVISYNSLEHLHPLNWYLSEFSRVLRLGGRLIGAIPAEGGVAWGLGRMLTTRRWFKKNTDVDLDKIICWEHPNFADQIVEELDRYFKREIVSLWPITTITLLDLNLVVRFCYTNEKTTTSDEKHE